MPSLNPTIIAMVVSANSSSTGWSMCAQVSAPTRPTRAAKAGAKYDGHQHYDENNFIIYKHGFRRWTPVA